MKSMIRTAALAMATAFVLAVCGCATTAEQRAGRPPRIEAQIEIRGLDAFLDSIDRLPLPDLPPRQVRTLIEQLGLGIAGISPFKITDSKGAAPIRVIVWKLPVSRGESGIIFDLPAAGGNPSAVVGKIAGTGVFKPRKLDGKDAAILPAGARRFHSPALKRHLLVVPHGNRVALMDITEISPASALHLLEEAPPLLAEGTLAIAPSPATLMDTMAGRSFAANSVEEFSVGFGIDDANRLRTSISLRPRPGKPLARLVSTVSAPASPQAGTLLFPSALAALSVRYSLDGLSDDELLPIFTARTDFSGYVRGFAGQHDKAGTKKSEALARSQLALHRLVGCETTAAVFPGNAAVPLPWAVLFTDLPSSPDVFDAFPSCLDSFLSARLDLLKAVAPSPDIAAVVGKLDLGIESAGERTVRGIPVRTYALRASNPDNPGQRSDILTFDVASVGGALLLGHLPGAALDSVLATLAAGKTSRGPLSALPAFSQTAGGVPRDAATGFIRGRPVLKNLLPAARKLVQTISGEWSLDTSGLPSDDEFAASLSSLPDFTLTYSCCWLPGENRMSSTFTLPMDDLKAVVDFFRKSSKASPTPSHGRR